MIVINPAELVTVQLTTADMGALTDHANQWCDMWASNPVLVQRYVTRRGKPLNANTITEHRQHVINAFMGELATARYLGAPYEMRVLAGDINPTDVDGVEVRAVDNMSKCLITRTYDKPAPYVLAVCDEGIASVVLRGWLHLRHCNVPAHWRPTAPNPAYFTPATELHPMAMLRHYYEQRKRR